MEDSELIKENNKLLKENNMLLNKIYDLLILMNSDDYELKLLSKNFGVGILSTVVSDKLLGLVK